jgi:hypothetical protein
MGQGISEVLTFAIGVAVSPIPIIAVILMLFSQRAKVNGPAFLVGWVVALVAVSTVVYVLAHDGDVATSSTATDSVSWGKIALGVLLLALARRNWRKRPGPGEEPAMPAWLLTVESMSPVKAFGLAVVLAAVNPKNLILTLGAATGLAQLGLSTSDAIVAIAVFVVVASLSIVEPVLYAVFGGARARSSLDAAKAWLMAHNAALLAVLSARAPSGGYVTVWVERGAPCRQRVAALSAGAPDTNRWCGHRPPLVATRCRRAGSDPRGAAPPSGPPDANRPDGSAGAASNATMCAARVARRR